MANLSSWLIIIRSAMVDGLIVSRYPSRHRVVTSVLVSYHRSLSTVNWSTVRFVSINT
jgi:hypothetical protein